MRHRRVDLLRLPGRGPVAQAVVGRAQVRTPLAHPAWDVFPRFAELRSSDPSTSRAGSWGAARALDLARMPRREPVAVHSHTLPVIS